MTKAVVTFYQTKYGFLDAVLPRFKRYASKVGAEMVEINMDGSTNVFMDKFFRVSELPYSRCLVLDVDILVRNDAPDLFSLVPEDAVGVFDEGASFHRLSGFDTEQINMRRQVYEHLLSYCGFDSTPIEGNFSFERPLNYYNLGVVVYNREAMDLHGSLPGDLVGKLYGYSGWSCAEQTLFSYLLLRSGLKVFHLASCFNHMPGEWCADYLETSYLCHYAGHGEIKAEEIMRDDMVWRARGL